MLNHISIAVNDTENVANVIAELWGGYAFPFPVSEKSWIVFANDGIGTAVEVTPADTIMVPGEGFPREEGFDITTPTEEYESKFVRTNDAPAYVATHMNINSKLSVAEIKKIADREGWRCFIANRGEGLFQLVEFWVEDRFLIEVMTPEMTERYIQVMQPEGYAAWVGVELPKKETQLELAA
ncbi:MAG: hypothetical protein DWQ47_13400 [Acidobacteria bacterium]|nr:MAG: hypothetical protein DWQ32_00800 [Acidobacteriota bacterium]REK02926.1 MAG: hypothetical protein DWQ38_11335 [Acidobacteriota bacterium]REK13270.1 MAG: hypothetical protein DWQ43_06490 [Acidobacteriota bacterium]REK41264.1 MAG: hypothetical protein DWQ47_13400 [Acidobacteriota bacterium]